MRNGTLFAVASEKGSATVFGPSPRVNTGVLLLHLRAMRERRLTKPEDFLAGRTYTNLNHDVRDQELISGWLAKRPSDGLLLPCRWNRRSDSRCKDPYGILHGNRGLFRDEYARRSHLRTWPLDPRLLEVWPASSRPIYNVCNDFLMMMLFSFEWFHWHDWHHKLLARECPLRGVSITGNASLYNLEGAGNPRSAPLSRRRHRPTHQPARLPRPHQPTHHPRQRPHVPPSAGTRS